MDQKYSKAAVRVSLLHFVFGKAFSAIGSILTLVLLARWAAPEVYGIYISLLALQVSLLALSTLGIETTAERFIPELRTQRLDEDLLGFILVALASRVATLAVVALVVWLFSSHIIGLVGLTIDADAFRSWAIVIFMTGVLTCSVVFLEALFRQRLAQLSMGAYVGLKLLAVVLVFELGVLDLPALVRIELFSTCIASALGLYFLCRRFKPGELVKGLKVLAQYKSRISRFAFFNYTAQMLFQLFSIELMKLIVLRILGVLQSAVYGFAFNLAETIYRYLPAVLLLRLIKPIFVSRYVQTGDVDQLNAMAKVVLKLNVFVLVPIIALAAAYGDQFLGLLSKGKYADGHWVLVGALMLLVMQSHQQVLSLLAGTLERNAMQLVAGAFSVVAFPAAIMFVSRWGIPGAIAASALGGLVYNTVAACYLRKTGFDYRLDVRGMAVIFLAGGVFYGISKFVEMKIVGVPGIALGIFAGAAVYLGIVRFLSAFSSAERTMMNSILPRKLFVF